MFTVTGTIVPGSFSEKIRILRKNREWTQAQLADALSVSESTVQKWEVDKNAPPVSEIKRLAEVFYLPITSLVDDAVDIPEFIYLKFEICFMASSDPLYSNLKRFFSNSRSPSSLILHSSFDIALLSTDK